MAIAQIPAKERGRLRLFAVNKTDDEVRALTAAGSHEVARLLGVQELNTDYVDVIRIADLGGLGLDDYLHTGYDIPRAQMEADAARLRAIGGHALVVLSLAFGDRAVSLPATPDLTLIATYGAPAPEWTPTETLTSEAATQVVDTGKRPPSEAAILGRVATVALLVIFIFTALMVWIA